MLYNLRGLKMKRINKIFAFEITALILISGSLCGMFVFTDIYDEVEARIVSVLCLSCVKLEPVISFNWYLDKNPPSFVLESLDKTGPIFIMYSTTDACSNCEIMEPIINEFFNVSYNKENDFTKVVNFNGTDITFVYVNVADKTEREYLSSKDMYDINNVRGVPMFTTITLRYDDEGVIKPYYNTLYGLLNQETKEQRIKILTRIINEAIALYKDNHEGFRVDDYK